MTTDHEATSHEPAEQHQMPQFIRRDIDALHRELDTFLKPGIHYEMHPGTKNARINKHGMEAITSRLGILTTPKEALRFRDGHMVATVSITGATSDGEIIGVGLGMCSTMEERYAYRISGRKCPSCGTESIIKSKRKPGELWCAPFKGGCGSNFNDKDAEITEQEVGKVPNEALADQYHTVLAMAQKRAHEDLLKKAFDIGGYVMARADRIPKKDAGQQARQAPTARKETKADAPASHDQAPRPGSPEDGESNPGQILTDMMRELTAAKGDAGALGEVLRRWHNCWERLPAGPFQTAKNNWERFDRIRQDLESMATA